MAINYWLSTSLFIFSVIALISGVYAFRIRYSGGATVLGAFAFTVAFYSAFYAIEIISSNIHIMQMIHSVKIVALALLPALVLLMTYKVIKKNEKLKPWLYIATFIIPLITIVLRLTYSFHTLYYYDFSLQSNGQFITLNFSAGVWYYVFAIYGMAALISAAVIHIINIKKGKSRCVASVYMIIALAVPIISGMLIVFGVKFGGVIILPFTLPVSSLFLFIGTVKHGMFDLVPLAQSRAFECSDNGIIVLDTNFCLVDLNPAAKIKLAELKKAVFGKNIAEVLDEGEQIKSAILSNTEYRIEIRKDNELFYYKINGSALLDKGRIITGYIVNIIDITALVNTMDELATLVSTDTLTGAQTRRHFYERAELEFYRAKRFKHPLSFIMLDLDLFKKVNDKFGHRAGDELLRNVTNICKKVIRSIDLLGRFGGEEFMVLLPETGIEGAKIVAERIRRLVEEEVLLFERKEIEISVSMGVTGVDLVKEETLDMFLKFADKALYNAKNKGRNRVEVLPIE